MKASSKKTKGRRLQNWVAEKISEITGYKYGKDECIAPREMGQSGTDIRLVGEVRKKFPFAIECKNQEKWKIVDWIKQAKENTDEELKDWLLVVSKNRFKPIVVMDAELFFEIWKRFMECNENE